MNNTITNTTEFNEACDQIARDELALKDLELDMANEMLAIRERKGPAIEAMKKSISGKKKTARSFLVKNKKTILGDKRSAESSLSKFGLRTSSSIKQLNRDWKTPESIQACLLNGHSECVITSRRLDKEQLEKLTDEQLAFVGLRKTKTENFWIDPKADKTTKTS